MMDHDRKSTTDQGLHTRVSKSGVYHREPCVLCGCVGSKESIAMTLCDGPTVLGRLCHPCIEAGPIQAGVDPADWTSLERLTAACDEADREVVQAMKEAGLSAQEICAMGVQGAPR